MITMNQKKNKLKTPGYFIKRLKDNDFVTLRIFDKYSNQMFKGNLSLKTDSIEVVVQKLLKSGVRQKSESDFLNK